MAHQKIKICISCHQLFRGRRDAKTCSERCRKRVQRVKTLLARETELAKESAEKALENLEHELKPAFATEEGFIGDTSATVATSGTPQIFGGTPSLVTPQNIPATPPSSGITEAGQPSLYPTGLIIPTVTGNAESLDAQPTTPQGTAPNMTPIELSPEGTQEPQPSIKSSKLPRFIKLSSSFLFLIAVFSLITFGIISSNHNRQANIRGQVNNIPQQEVSISGATSALETNPIQLQDAADTLIVNGNLAVHGNMRLYGSQYYAGLQLANLTNNQTYTLPNASGTICLDSNNCNYATTAQVTQIAGQTGLQGGTGIILVGKLITNSGVLSANGLSGDLTIVGTANQINIAVGSSNITLSLPQDIGTGSTPHFQSVNLTAPGTQNGHTICDNSNNCGYGMGGGGGDVNQGGNGFGATMELGTTDNYGLNLETNNTTVASFSNSGAALFKNTSNSASAFRIQDALGTNLVLVNTTAGTVTIVGLQGSGAGLTNLNASNVSSGTLSDARLSNNVTLQGNTFNGASQLVQLTAGGILPVLSGANLTNLNATNISSGTVADARLSTNVTVQGNTFNGASQLVQLNGSIQLPAVSGINLTNLNATNIASGTLSDSRLSTNVALLNGSGPQTFTGNNKFTGTVLAENAVDSTVAFQVQNAAGNELLRVDTSGSHIALGKASTLSADLVFYNAGGSGSITLQGSNPGINNYAITLPNASGTVCLTSGNCAGIGGTGDVLQGGNTFGTALTLGTNDNYGLNLETNNTTVASFTNTGAALFKNSSNSTTAFQVQNAAGTSLLTADTSNMKVNVNGLLTLKTGYTVVDDGFLTLGQTSIDYNARLSAIAGSATIVPIQAKGASGQTANLQEWRSNTALLLAVDPSGKLAFGATGDTNLYRSAANTLKTDDNFLVQTASDSITAFQVQNAAGNELLRVDTSGSHIALGKASTLSADLVFYNAGGSGSITLQGSNPGASNYAITLPNASGTVCLTSGNCAGVGGTGDVLQGGNSFGTALTLGTNDNYGFNLETNNTTVASFTNSGAALFKNATNSTTAFQVQNAAGTSNLLIADTSNTRIGIGMTGPGQRLTIANTTYGWNDYIGITNGTKTATIGLASAIGTLAFATGATASGDDAYSFYNGAGTAKLLGISNSGATIFKNSANSTTAFQIQNAGTNSMFNVDTTGGYVINNGVAAAGNLLQNPGFESTGSTTGTGWSNGLGSFANIVTNAAIAHSGNSYLAMTPDGSHLTTNAVQEYAIAPGDQVYLEGWVNTAAGTNGSGGFFLTWKDKDGSFISYSNGIWTNPGTSWTLRTITATAPAGAVRVGVNTTVRADSTTGTWYFDDLYFRRITEQAPALFQNSVNSATAFQVQNAAGTSNLLIADTTNTRIGIGIAPTATLDVNGDIKVPGAGNNFIGNSLSNGIRFDGSGNYNVSLQSGNGLGLVYDSGNNGTSGFFIGKATNDPDTATKVVTIANNGATLFQNSANSATAFQIQNAAGNELLRVDTSGSHIALGKASTLSADLVFYNAGGSGSITLQGSNPGINNYAITLPNASGTVCLTSGNCAGIGGTGDVLQGGNTFGTALTLGTNDNYGLNLETNNTTVASFTNTGAALFKNSSNSTTAFQVQNAAGTSNLLIADTTNTRIGIGSVPDAALSVRSAGQNAVVDIYGLSASTDYGVIQVSSAGGISNPQVRDLILQPNGGYVGIGNMTNPSAELTIQGTNTEATLGSELLSSSTCSGTNWSGSGTGPYTHTTGSPVALSCTPPASVTQDATYLVVFTVTGNTGNTVTPQVGGDDGVPISGNSTDETQLFRGVSGTTNLQFIPTSAFTGTVTITSLKQLTRASSLLDILNSDTGLGLQIRGGGSALQNTAVGAFAMQSNINGSWNTALGYGALIANTTGDDNVALGYYTLSSNTTGSKNIAIGGESLSSNTTGDSNNAVGYNALASNTTGYDNNAFGLGALNANTTGYNNNAFGNYALVFNVTGMWNNAVGYSALYHNTSGYSNNAMGDNALTSNTTGNNNTAVGDDSLQFSTTSDWNTAIGRKSLQNNTTGNENVGLGESALRSNTTGSNNTAVGGCAGYSDGCLGVYDGFSTLSNLQNATMIGAAAQAQASDVLILGGAGDMAVNVGIGTTSPTNLFSVSPVYYSTGTAYQSTTTITGVGTTWTSAMVGMEFIFSSGQKETITGFTSTTVLTGSVSQTVSSNPGIAYRIHNPAFYVSSTGSAALRSSTNSTTAFQVQNSAGTSLLTADTTNLKLNVGGDVNVGTSYGSRLFSDDFESGTFGKWGFGNYNGGSSTSAISTVQAHGGKYSALFTENGCCAAAATPLNPSSTVVARGYYYVTSASSGGMRLLTFTQSSWGNYIGQVERDAASGTVKYLNAVTTVTSDSGVVMPMNQWVKLEVKVVIGNPTGTTTIWMNDTQILSLTSQNNGTNNIGTLQIGNEDSPVGTYYADDVSADTTQTGASANLNVGDSLHVGGTSSFGNNVLIKPASNSTTAFQIQNAAGGQVLGVDTTADASNLVTNGSFDVNYTGWQPEGSSTLTQITSQHYVGQGALQVATTAAAGDGAKYNVALASSTSYTLSVFAKLGSGTASGNISIGRSENGSSDTSCLTNQTFVTGGWTQFTCNFTTGTTSGTTYIYVKKTTATTPTFYLDAVKLVQTSSSYGISAYRDSALALNSVVSSPVNIQGSSDATTALQVQNSAGAQLLNVDTLNGVTNVGYTGTGSNPDRAWLTLQSAWTDSSTDVAMFDFGESVGPNAGSLLRGGRIQYDGSIGGGNTISIGGLYNTTMSTVIRYGAGGAELLLQNNSGGNHNLTILNKDAAGSIILKPGTGADSTIAIQLQNASSKAVLTADTSGGQILLGTLGTGGVNGTLVFNSATAGNYAVTLGATSSLAASYTLQLPTGAPSTGQCLQTTAGDSTQLIFGSCAGSSSGMTAIGTIDSQTKSSNGAVSASGNLVLQTADYTNPGLVSTTTQTFTGDKTFKSTTDSATALQVQSAAGAVALAVDTVNDNVGIGVAASTTAKLYASTGSFVGLRINQSGSNDILQLQKSSASVVTVSSTGATLFKNSTNSATALQVQNAAGSTLFQVDTSNSKVGVTAGNDLVFDIGTNNAVARYNSGSNAVQIANYYTSGSTQIYGDSVGLYDTTGYHLNFNMSNTGAITLQNRVDSATAFQVQNAGSTAIITADTTNSKIQIGSSTTDATAILLVLDSYNTTDPSGTNGAMYYSTSTNTFRCYENGAWTDCLSRHKIVLSGDVSASSGACTITNLTGLSFATVANVPYKFYAVIDYTAAATTTGSNWSATVGNITRLSYVTHSVLSGGTTGYIGGGGAVDAGGCSASSVTTAANTAVLEGSVLTSANGTLQLRFATEINSSAITAKAGSTLEWWTGQ